MIVGIRVWDVENKKMIECAKEVGRLRLPFKPVGPNLVYTKGYLGMCISDSKDKHGKDIALSDYVSVTGDFIDKSDHLNDVWIGRVKVINGYDLILAGLSVKGEKVYIRLSQLKSCDYEVIGNSFENPELKDIK